MSFHKNRDVISGIALLVCALILYWMSFDIRSISTATIKADAFPRLDAIFIGVLGLIILISGIKDARKAKQSPQDTQDASPSFWSVGGNRCLVYTLVLIALYVGFLDAIGFIITSIVYLIAQMWVLAPNDKRTLKDIGLYALIAVITSCSLYYLFVNVFYLLLPAGIFYL